MIRSRQVVVRSITTSTKKSYGKSYTYYRAHIGSDPVSGRRIEIVRSTKAELLEAIGRYYDAFRAGVMPGDVKDAMSAKDIAELRSARALLGDMSVLDAATIVAKAKEALDRAGLGDTPVLDAVASFASSKSGVNPMSLADALDAYIATFNEDQETYRGVIRSRVGRAVLELGADRLVSDVTPVEAMDYLERNFGASAEKTFNNNLGDLRSFFSWCAKPVRAYCKENPLASAEKRREAKKDVKFLSADDTKRWFDILLASACDEKSKMYLWWNALGFFAGARTAEIHRLTWKDIDLAGGTVRFAEPKGFAHGVPPRYVKLNDAALAWMKAAPLTRGFADMPVFAGVDETRSVSNYLDRLAKKNGIVIPRNAARHTFVTMHVAAYHNAALTESIVGTSSTMRRGHYQGLVKEEEAKRYFAIRP